jgi:hypothetical protein
MAFANKAVSMVSGNVVGAPGAAQTPPKGVPMTHYGPNVTGARMIGAGTAPAIRRARVSAPVRSVTQYRSRGNRGMRGLGTTSAMVGQTLTFGSQVPVTGTIVRRPGGPIARPNTSTFMPYQSPLPGIVRPSTPPSGTGTGWYYVGSGPQAGQACDPASMVAFPGVSCQQGNPPATGPSTPSPWGATNPWGGNPDPNQFPGPGGPGWGGGGGGSYSGGSSTWGSSSSWGSGNPNNPTSQNNLAQLVLLYQSNPSSLTQAQWQQLQAAGVIPSTVPYSNAALVNPQASSATGAGAIDPATGIPYATELATAEAGDTTATAATSSIFGVDPANGASTIFGIDWYYVVGGGVLAYALFSKSGRR